MVSQGSIDFAGAGKRQGEWAKLLSCSQAYVSQLKLGKATPGHDMREKIHAAGGPEPRLWDQLVHKPAKIADVIADREAKEPSEDTGNTVRATPERVQEMADQLMGNAVTLQRLVMAAEMDEVGRVRALSQLASILTETGKLTGAAQINDRQIRLSPAFRQLVEKLVDILRPWPDALRAIHAELSNEA